MNWQEWIDAQGVTLDEQFVRRELKVWPTSVVDLASNDYLGLAADEGLRDAAAKMVHAEGTASSASRVLSGTRNVHLEFEQEMAAFLGAPACLLFSSGYLANLGVITSLLTRHDTAYADRVIHASLLDAIRLSGARLRRYPHNDVGALRRMLAEAAAGRALVVTESLFSMDGDCAPIADLFDVCRSVDGMLLVDEAHALGVCGATGEGLTPCELQREPSLIRTGTASKAFASYGGFVAASRAVIDLLVSKSRTFIFNTALPPAVVAASRAALGIIAAATSERARLQELSRYVRRELSERGLLVAAGDSPIVPVIVGDNQHCLRAQQRLRDEGVWVAAIRPPTVPEGTARIRLSLHAQLDVSDLDRVLELLPRVLKEEA